MRGGARTGAGRKPKPIATHVLQGTYRRDRHGPRTPPPAPLPYDWKPDPADLERLSPKARAFIADSLRSHEYNYFAGRVLMEAADTLDLLEACQRAIDEHGVMVTGPRGARRMNPMVREHRRHAAWLLRALKALKLE